MERTVIIGIAGGSGSGKTTITQHIKTAFGDKVNVICHDSYYKTNAHLSFDERTRLNYDHPDAFETELLVDHLNALKKGEPIACPVYDFKLHTRSTSTVDIYPAGITIVEGILIFYDDILRNMFDMKIYVGTDADTRIIRRILRDTRERGRSVESVTEQYMKTIKPMHEKYVEPSKKQADIIVNQGGYNIAGLDMILCYIKERLKNPIKV